MNIRIVYVLYFAIGVAIIHLTARILSPQVECGPENCDEPSSTRIVENSVRDYLQ